MTAISLLTFAAPTGLRCGPASNEDRIDGLGQTGSVSSVAHVMLSDQGRSTPAGQG